MGGGAGRISDLVSRLRRYRERLAAEHRHSEAAYVDEAIAEVRGAANAGSTSETEPRQ